MLALKPSVDTRQDSMDSKGHRGEDSNLDRRREICKSLGIAGPGEVHEIVVAGARRGVKELLRKKLYAQTLVELGYDESGMRTLGYDRAALEQLGYYGSRVEKRETHGQSRTFTERLLQAVEDGDDAEQLKASGFTLHHCKVAEISARQAYQLGFGLHELKEEYSLYELKQAGCRIPELRRLFSGQELRKAFPATEMRPYFGIRQLLEFGYTENQVRTAGYSDNELAMHGLSRRPIDRRPLQRG